MEETKEKEQDSNEEGEEIYEEIEHIEITQKTTIMKSGRKQLFATPSEKDRGSGDKMYEAGQDTLEKVGFQKLNLSPI